MTSKPLPWHKSCLYMLLTVIFFAVGTEVAGWGITILMFLAIIVLVEMNKSASK